MGVEERVKVVAFCRWVLAYWYESMPIQDCKMFSFIIKNEDKDDDSCGFLPHWVSTKDPGVLSC